jgi:catechol 2,3-dioxygenase
MGHNRIDHAAIRVVDMGAAIDWYEGILGLKVLDRTAERAHIACRGGAVDLTIHTGGNGYVSCAFGVDSTDDLDALAKRLDGHNVAYERLSGLDRPGTDQVLRTVLPSGHDIEFSVGADGRRAGILDESWDGETYVACDLDHVNLLGDASPKVVAEYLRDVLGFKISVGIQDGDDWLATWTRWSQTDHDLAYMRAVKPGDRLHHVAFFVKDLNHYAKVADRLGQTGYTFEYGPGRHPGDGSGIGFGTNLFAYAFDPSGNRNEWSSDMAEFADDAEPVLLAPPENLSKAMNLWADNMPESFMTVGS